jgi:hypothetical protein
MKLKLHIIAGCTAFAAFITLWVSTSAQEKRPEVTSRTIAYNASCETVLQGTVLAYAENPPRTPIGAHVTVQTGSGTVEVHLGPASYLRANHFSLAPGDSVRFVGMISREGAQVVFLARIAQKGSQVIAIRSTQGFLLARGAPRCMSKEQRAQPQEAGPR